MGATQHTNGTQIIRAYGILQLLLGNIGIAGGGINALRGESNVQGSTDQGLLWHILTGYLKSPLSTDLTLADYIARTAPKNSDPRAPTGGATRPSTSSACSRRGTATQPAPRTTSPSIICPRPAGRQLLVVMRSSMPCTTAQFAG